MITWKTVAIHAIAICAAVAGISWYSGHRDEALASHEQRIVKLETNQEEYGKSINLFGERMARMEEQLRYMNENVRRLLEGKGK